jgi:hypothetical protein
MATGRGITVWPARGSRRTDLHVAIIALAPPTTFKQPVALSNRRDCLASREVTARVNPTARDLANVQSLATWVKRIARASTMPIAAHKADARPLGF